MRSDPRGPRTPICRHRHLGGDSSGVRSILVGGASVPVIDQLRRSYNNEPNCSDGHLPLGSWLRRDSIARI